MKYFAVRRSPLVPAIAFAMICIFVALWSSDTVAHTCGVRSWEYNEKDLAEARRRLKSPEIQTLHARVDCAETIIGTPGLAGPFAKCTPCAQEYVGLLADGAVYMRRAADEAAVTEKARKAYLLKEVATRQRIHVFLSSDEQAEIRNNYFNNNLLALADAMERTAMASEYNQLVTALSETSKLELQMYRVWIKAVRSCAVWDFKSVDSAAVLKKSLCNSDCIENLKAVYAGLQKAGLLQPDGKVKTSMPVMPVPAECQKDSQ